MTGKSRLLSIIAWRYLLSRKGNRFVSVVSVIAVLGIAIGVAALIVVLSVMNGMQGQLTQQILDMTASVTVSAPQGKALTVGSNWVNRLKGVRGVSDTALQVRGRAILTANGTMTGTVIRGIVPGDAAAHIARKMLVGRLTSLTPGKYRIVIGRGIAMSLGVVPGDRVTVVLPSGLITPIGFLPRSRRFTVAGVFYTGSASYDDALALINRQDAERLYNLTGSNLLRIRLTDPFRAAQVSRRLKTMVPHDATVTNWMQTHASFLAALGTEKRMMFVLLSLAIVIAAGNILATLILTAADKRTEFAVLNTLGLGPRHLVGLMLELSLMIAGLGIGLGLIVGLPLAAHVGDIVDAVSGLLRDWMGQQQAYAVEHLPSVISVGQVVAVVCVAGGCALLAGIVPAWRIAAMQPSEELRHG